MMGVSYSELWQMTEYEFNLMRKGFQRKEMAEWERTRFIAWMVQAVQTTKPLSITQVLPLPIDPDPSKIKKPTKLSKKVSKRRYEEIANMLKIKK